jgi:hypothetical protein
MEMMSSWGLNETKAVENGPTLRVETTKPPWERPWRKRKI